MQRCHAKRCLLRSCCLVLLERERESTLAMDSDWWNTIQYNSSTRMFERHFHVRDRSKLFGARVVRKGAPLNLKEQWALPIGAWG